MKVLNLGEFFLGEIEQEVAPTEANQDARRYSRWEIKTPSLACGWSTAVR